MSYAIISQELEQRLDALGPALPTVWENTEYKPSNGTAYQRVSILPATTENPSVGTGYQKEVGIFQVLLYYPENVGRKDVIAKAEAIKAQFPRGWSVTASNVRVLIDNSPYISTAFNSEGWYVMPVSIPFIADIF